MSEHISDDEDDVALEDIQKDLEEEEKAGKGKWLSAKKWLGSKTAGSKLGRKVIMDVLGDMGQSMITALKDASQADIGEEKSKKYKKDILRMAVKLKVMADDNVINLESTKHLSDPMNLLGKNIVEVLQKDTKQGPVDISDVAKQFAELRPKLLDVIRGKIQDKNLAVCEELLNYYGGKDFMGKVINDEKYKKPKDTLLESLSIILAPVLQELDANNSQGRVQLCAQYSCPFPRCKAQLDDKGEGFGGSIYCATHHQDHYKTLLDKPTIEAILNDKHALSAISQFLKAETSHDHDGRAFHFYLAVQEYKSLSRNIRQSRVRMIISKHLGKKAWSYEISEAVMKKINEQKIQAPRELFDEAADLARKELEKVLPGFIKSKFYDNWKKTIELPSNALADLEKQMKELKVEKK